MGRTRYEPRREKAAFPPLTTEKRARAVWKRNPRLFPGVFLLKGGRDMTKKTKPKTVDKGPSSPNDIPPAGQHAKPSLTDCDKTPGAGSLPDDDAKDVSPGGG